MKITFTFLPEYNLVLQRFSGAMTIKALKEVTPNVWSHKHYHKQIDAWIDLRQVDLNLSTDDLGKLTMFLQESDQSSGGKLALILRDPGDIAFAHTFEQHMIFRRSMGIFTTPEEGFEFLDVPAEVVRALDGEEAITMEAT